MSRVRRWFERIAVVGLLLLAAGAYLSWWTVPTVAQSTQVAPFVRDVNSQLIYNLLNTIEDTVTGTVDVDVVAVNGTAPLNAVTSGTLQNAATANGNGSTLNTNGYAGVIFTVNCSACSGGTTITLEGNEDGTNYDDLKHAVRIDEPGTLGPSFTTAGITVWYAPVSGLQAVRARISNYSAGTVTVTARTVLSGDSRLVASAPVAISTGGASTLKYTSVGTTEDEHAVCTGPCNVYSITATNHTSVGVFLRCENDTAANTTPGSETVELDLEIPGDSSGRGFSATFPVGASFSTALTCWIVTGEADTDVAEVGANDAKIFYTFKQ
jgi:hypothetical protein